ncbi:MAG TPA: thiol:disulfide interchange protein DsbA/DsbL [Steroidobacteraceae bacterium]|jgi:thiol:disulfide interchange protein DsbA
MRIKFLGVLALLCFVSGASAQSAQWVEGTNYLLVDPAQRTNVPAGKVEVTEVFSYACPACNAFYPYMDALRRTLPASAVVDYVPAAFNSSEDWPVFQRAYLTAKALGISTKTHDAMFDAVWKTHQLETVDPQTERLRNPLPSIEDVAAWYHQQAGTPTQTFLAAAHSFGIDLQVHQSDAYIMACQVDQTPTIIVNGKYRVDPSSAGGYAKMIDLVKWLVAKEAQH